ncbi:hypothetical protein RJ639_032588 [Escallonia herrerae]|uniref:non-specific serine/threonine protein kinase n=1 Tax=Escallonia herrerae TaxID=1293975 RepID=A0AA89BKG8_9ASTE|nr:hypothetical protein RJ639_032588 [Escallonia herrerae]
MAISPSVVFVIALFFACEGRAQTTNATTDLYEARALNSIFQQWDISASSEWNISGEPCSGAAIDSKIVDDPSFNPAIKCDCSYNFASTCHIIALNLAQNYLSGYLPPSVGNLARMQYFSFGTNSFYGPLPSELGNLTKLEQLYFDSSGVSGDIPSTFANLQMLSILRISDISDGNTSLGFLKDMKSLDVLYVNGKFLVLLTVKGFELQLFDWTDPRLAVQFEFTPTRLAIKCGGPQYTSPDQIVYERDNETLGVATYYVTPTNRWAVSNVGLPTGSNSLSFTNSWDSELFQTARLSAGSLRYYGLGLQNGEYTVRLQFAEIDIPKTTWKSIKGNLTLKDFDIQMEALVSYSSVVREFRVQVSKNYLEIHLFWAGKGTCCIPAQGTYGPSISAISVTPNFIPGIDSNGSSTSGNPTTKKKSRTSLIAGTVVAVAVVSCLSAFAVYFYVERRKTPRAYEEFLGLDARPYTFSYSELRDATDDFSSTNKLGEGGFGPVYKGTLDDGRAIAVKQLSVASNHGKSQFVTEIATISAVQHRNLVKLHGCCIEGDKRLLVYEYLENRSLDQAFGYLAPEYALRGHLTEKADVFGFGVVALEIVSGRANSDASLEEERVYLLEWAWHLHENNREVELVDAKLSDFDENAVKRVIGVALLCTQTSPTLRPSMSRVVAMLSGDVEVSAVTSRPGYLTDWTFNDASTCTSGDPSRSDYSYYSSSTGAGIVADPNSSPVNAAKPMLGEIT